MSTSHDKLPGPQIGHAPHPMMARRGLGRRWRLSDQPATPSAAAPVVDRLLLAYMEAPGLEEAVAALDDLVPGGDLPAQVLGDCYDELAEVAAEEDECMLAAHLEKRALQLGCRHRKIAREMLAWYLLKGGSTAEGEAEFAALRTERPGDVDHLMTLANVRSDAGPQGRRADPV